MATSEPGILALAFLAGGALGAMFFGGLWWTVLRGASSATPARWFLASALLRMGLTLAGFHVVAGGQADLLIYETRAHGEVCLGVDEGVLVKAGSEVLVSVRRAMGGADLGQLRAVVEREYLTLDEDERSLREVSAKLESGFLHRFAEFQRD